MGQAMALPDVVEQDWIGHQPVCLLVEGSSFNVMAEIEGNLGLLGILPGSLAIQGICHRELARSSTRCRLSPGRCREDQGQHQHQRGQCLLQQHHGPALDGEASSRALHRMTADAEALARDFQVAIGIDHGLEP